MQTEEIETYLPILSMLLSFSPEDTEIVKAAFSEKESFSFSFF